VQVLPGNKWQCCFSPRRTPQVCLLRNCIRSSVSAALLLSASLTPVGSGQKQQTLCRKMQVTHRLLRQALAARAPGRTLVCRHASAGKSCSVSLAVVAPMRSASATKDVPVHLLAKTPAYPHLLQAHTTH
jgi:hypothetical protein